MATNRNIESIIPVTELQEGMLYHIVADGSERLHWNQLAYTIEGELDLARFRLAWEFVVATEPALRAAFVTARDGRWLQVIQAELTLPWSQLDWSDLESVDRDSAQQIYLDRDLAAAPKLKQAPLMRVGVAKLGPTCYRVFWSQHHLIVDGWSCPLVLARVASAYGELGKGRKASGPLRLEFARYVNWQGQASQPRALDAWSNYLAGFVPHTSFGDNATSHRALELTQACPLPLVNQVTEFTQQFGITLATLLNGVWALTLAAETGHHDVVFGLMHADRDAAIAGIEDMVGLAVRTVVARFDTTSEEPLSQWLQNHQRQFGAMLAARVPLAEVVSSVRGAAGASVFESLVVVENFSVGGLLEAEPNGWKLSDFESHESTSYPLTLTVHLHQGLELVLTSDGSVDEARGQRVLARYQQILQNLLADAMTPVREIPWLLDTEPKVLEGPSSVVVGDLLQSLEQFAERQPNKSAVVFDGVSQSYAELWQQVLRISLHLDDAGIGFGSKVAMNLERSPLLVATMLAVWMRGAAYVPLGADYPAARIIEILEDSCTDILLTWRPQAFVGSDVAIVSEATLKVSQNTSRILDILPIDASTLAYVIYTSGSTGKPNGVSVSRYNVESFLAAMRIRPGIGPTDRLLAVTNVTFDISVLELLLPLSVGATVVLANADQVGDGFALVDLAQECSLMQGTPATWHLMLAAGWQTGSALRAITGGEALNSALATDLLQRTSEVWNAYGPTETTVWVTLAKLERAAQVSIGTPIAGTQVAVADACGRTLPPGVVGELRIGGANVAQGYWRRDSLTAQRFQANEHLGYHFRSGDLAYWDEAGQLHCLGRQDHQIKLRGFRIELGEIEQTLESHPAVRRACVLFDEQQQRLSAYFTGVNEPKDLRDYLAHRLPSYMVPQHIVMLEAMPLNASGKIDRVQLGRLETVPQPHQSPAPESESERYLVDLVAEILDVAAVSRDDYFFNLGGHSLLAMKMIGRVQADTGIRLPPSSIAMEALHEVALRLNQQQPSSIAGRLSRLLRGTLGSDSS